MNFAHQLSFRRVVPVVLAALVLLVASAAAQIDTVADGQTEKIANPTASTTRGVAAPRCQGPLRTR